MNLRRFYPLVGCALFAVGCSSEASNSSGRFDLNEPAATVDAGTDIDNGPDAIAPQPKFTGAACAADGECEGQLCQPAPGFPEGYCSAPCEGQCADTGSLCVPGESQDFCARRCLSNEECRADYECVDPGVGDAVCLPVGFVPPAPSGLTDGSPCTQDGDCRGGTCLAEPEWPGGFCTTLDCQTREDCQSDGEDNRCYRGGADGNLCVRMCTRPSDCRQDYECQPIGRGQAVCVPNPRIPLELGDLARYPFAITCQAASNGTVEIAYDVPEGTTAYMVTPMNLDGGALQPSQMVRPSGATLSFRSSNTFQLIPSQLFGFINPMVFPPTAQTASQLEVGAHRLVVRTESEQMCHYVLHETSPGTVIDFNIYLVGVPNLDAATAANNASLQAVLASFNEIYAAAGIQIGKVRYIDIEGDDRSRHSVIRSDGQVAELVALSGLPEGGYDAALSANIFFVRRFAFSDGGGAIGISNGLPGAAGLHGSPSSGVVFTSEYMGQFFNDESGQTVSGDAFTGIVLAHEVGHFLGLFHTSEQFGQGFDPLPDTPQCRTGFPNSCPDLGNLMFPLASNRNTVITADQKWVIEVNPLTKESLP